jgi:hypothetical protein
MGWYATHDSRQLSGSAKFPTNRCLDMSRGQAWKLASATWPDEKDRDMRFCEMVMSTPGAVGLRLRGGWTLYYSHQRS